MSIGWDVVQRGFMLGLKKDHTKPYLLAQVLACKWHLNDPFCGIFILHLQAIRVGDKKLADIQIVI